MKTILHALAIFLMLFSVLLGNAQADKSELISTSPEGWLGDGDSLVPRVTADGRFVVFQSDATNLVPNDNNEATDIFVYDRLNKVMERVSVDSQSNEVFGRSIFPFISENGRYVAFISESPYLTTGFNHSSIYIRDRETGVTKDVDLNGVIPKTSLRIMMSGDGSTLLVNSPNLAVNIGLETPFTDIVIVDNTTGKLSGIPFVSDADHISGHIGGGVTSCALSYDGMRIIFNTSEDYYWYYKNIYRQIDTINNVHVYDRATNTIYDLSRGTNKKSFSDSRISADGNWVAYEQINGDITIIQRFDGKKKQTLHRTRGINYISGSGRYLATNKNVYDRETRNWEPLTDELIHTSNFYLTPNTRFLTFSRYEVITTSQGGITPRSYSHVYLYDRGENIP